MASPVTPGTTAQAPRRRLEPWPLVIIGFFVVVFAANAAFIYLATDTFNGVVVEKHYEKGLAFNQVLEAQRRQNALGWLALVDIGAIKLQQPGTLVMRVSDEQGRPVTGLSGQGMLFRPVASGHDQELRWVEAAPGRYEAVLTLPLPGRWDVKSILKSAGGDEFRHAFRIDLR
ncbi:MAG: FixH family protein [Magnetococcus sp. WYHC-3]